MGGEVGEVVARVVGRGLGEVTRMVGVADVVGRGVGIEVGGEAGAEVTRVVGKEVGEKLEVGSEVGGVEDASLLVSEVREGSSGGWVKSSEMLLFLRVDASVTRFSKSYTVVVASTGECWPVRVSIGVTPGKAAELAIALSTVAHAENSSIKTDLSAKVLRGDKLG